jgi:lambda family phage tail tape measure protein
MANEKEKDAGDKGDGKDDKDEKKDQVELSDTVISTYDQMMAKQKSWSSGATLAWNTYLFNATDVAKQTQGVFTKAFTTMDAAVYSFATTGKASFNGFAQSVLADMIHIATQQATSSLLSGLVSLGTSLFSSGGPAAAATTKGVQIGTQQFLGGFDPTSFGVSFPQVFANGGAFTDSIVSKPTAFGMPDGTPGLMGEAGPEAIMPLTRTANGKLGVQAMSGGGGSPTVNISIASDGTSNVSGDSSGLEQFGREMGEIAAQKYRELESRSLSSQGNIRNAINGR